MKNSRTKLIACFVLSLFLSNAANAACDRDQIITQCKNGTYQTKNCLDAKSPMNSKSKDQAQAHELCAKDCEKLAKDTCAKQERAVPPPMAPNARQ